MYSDRFYDSSVKLNSLRYFKAYFTFMYAKDYIQGKIEATYIFWGVKRVFYWLVNDDSDKCHTEKSRLDQ